MRRRDLSMTRTAAHSISEAAGVYASSRQKEDQLEVNNLTFDLATPEPCS